MSAGDTKVCPSIANVENGVSLVRVAPTPDAPLL
jgi:hypothetical protein